MCDRPPRRVELLEQVNNEFQVAQIVPSPQGPMADRIPSFRMEQCNPPVDSDARPSPVEVFFSERPARGENTTGNLGVEAILVRLGQFRVVVLPQVNEANLSALKCGHADVVYCGRQTGRRFPRALMIAKLSPAILVLSGTKSEMIANSVNNHSGPKCFYLRQEGAVSAALLNGELVVRGYCGSEARLPSLSR
jgi:hypothetical protein